MQDELIIKAEPKEINAIISFINIIHHMKDDFVSLEYNNGGSHLVIPKGYFQNINLHRKGKGIKGINADEIWVDEAAFI